MIPRWILLLGLFALISIAHSQRSRSRFRPRQGPNPFDRTQPQGAESIQTETAVANTVSRRRPVVGDRAIRRRIGSVATPNRRRGGGKRRKTEQRKNFASKSNNRINIVEKFKPIKPNFRQSPRIRNQITQVPPTNPAKDGYKIVCYYTNWSQYRPTIGKFMPEDIDPYLCTHIIYAFAGLSNDGRLKAREANDESQDGKIGLYEQVTGLKRLNPKLKVLIALGGWTFGTKKFQNLTSTRFHRQNFIYKGIPFLRKHNFDGLDLDWEYPSGKRDKNNLNYLVKEMYEAFEAEGRDSGKPRLLLTAAVSVGPDKIKAGYDIPFISKYLDFINVMAYDFHGKWENTVGHNSPLFAPSSDSEWRKQLSVSYASDLWNRLGAPKEKMIIGMALYGRSFTLTNNRRNIVNSPATGGGPAGRYTKEEGFLSYYEICELLHEGGAYYWDEEMQVPYMVKEDLWVGFDDERAIRNKMKWLKNGGFGGAMIWSMDMDDFKGSVCGGNVEYPLIGIMREELMGKPRNGRDVDWSKITSTAIAQITTLPPPIAIDAVAGVKAFLAAKAAESSIINVASVPKHSPKILCYVTSWSKERGGAGRFEPDSIDPFICTHLIYAFATLKENRLSERHPSDLQDGFRNGTYSRLAALKEKNPTLKIMLSLGGWEVGSKPFRELVSNQYRLNGFVYDALNFLRHHKFDGLDISWEYPKGPDDKANFINMLKELRIAFEGEAKSTGHPRILLSTAVPASFEAMFAGYDVPEMSKYLDFINIMTYDFHGSWENQVGHNAPLYPLDYASSHQKKMTIDYSVKAWIKEGAPPQKIMLGMPAYGRSFKLANAKNFDIGAPAIDGAMQGRYTKEKGFLSYYEICEFLFEDNTTLVWDNEQHVPFAYNGLNWVGFDDERSFSGKIDWLKKMNLGGVMIWSADVDDFRGNCVSGKYPLINTIVNSFSNYTVPITYDGPYENTGTNEGKFTIRDPNEVSCDEAEGHISFHSDVNECAKYYMCEGERKHHMSCPVNLVFNQAQSVCDWVENVEGCSAPTSR